MPLKVCEEPVGVDEFERRCPGADGVLEAGEAGRERRHAHHAGEGAHAHRMVATEQPGCVGVHVAVADALEHSVRAE